MRKHLLLAALAALGGTSGVRAEPAQALDADPLLAGWWTLDETAGTKAADASTHARHGTLQGGLAFETQSVPGRLGKALQFDGKQGLLEITGYKGIPGTKPRTVAAWLKTKRNRGEILGWGSDDCGKMWIFGFIRGRVGINPLGGYYYMNDETHDDRWHHVAAVMSTGDPPNLNDNVTLYLNGTPAKLHDIGLLDLWPLDTGDATDVRIGKGFEGALDDIRLYERVLTQDEIRSLFEGK